VEIFHTNEVAFQLRVKWGNETTLSLFEERSRDARKRLPFKQTDRRLYPRVVD
jgi:hypothetical protein